MRKNHLFTTPRRLASGLGASAAGLALIASPASATSLTWSGATAGLWGTSTNWNPNATPTTSDDLTILGPSNVAGALTINVAAAASANTINITNTAATTLSNTTSGSNQILTIAGGLTTGTGAVTIGSATANQNINVALGASQTWNVGSGGLTVNNVISDGGSAYGLTKTGAGTLTLAGANTYIGTTTLNQGTATLSGSISSSSALAFGGGTLNYTKAGTNTQTFASTTVNSGFSTITNATATNTVALGTITRNSGGILNVSSLTGATTTSTAVDSTGILGTWATTGTGTALKYAAGGSGGNITAYTGTSVADATGVTDTTGVVNYDVAAVGALGASASFNTLRYTGAAGTITGNFTANGLMNAGSGALVYSGNVTIGANKELVIVGNTQATTLSGVISNNGGGASSLVYGGPSAGALTLSNASNTYSGGTTLNSGTLLVQGNSTPTTAGSTVTSGPLGTGTLTLNGGTFGFATAGTVYTIANNVNVTGATNIQVVSGTNEVLNGNWSGSGNLTLIPIGSTGQWQFGGNNSGYTGTFTQNTGNTSLAFNSASAGSASAAWVFNNATNQRTRLNFAGGGTINFGSIAGNGSIANVFASGTATMSVGALNTSTTYSGIIGGSSAGQGQNIALTKVGTGVLTLSGTNTYTAGTTISAGKLNVTNATSGTGSGAVAVSGGTSATLGGTGTLTGAVTVTNGSRIAPGAVTSSSNFGSAGTLTLSSASGLTLTDAHLDLDLSTTAGGTNDKIALGANALTFATLNFSFSGTTLDTTTAYTLVATTGSLTSGTVGSITTDFSAVTGGNYAATYSFVAGTGLQVSFTAVPEPHEFAIAISALLGVLVFIRRRNQQA